MVKLSLGAGVVITNYGSGSCKEIYRKSHRCISTSKKVYLLKSTKALFKVRYLIKLSVIKINSKSHKNVHVDAGVGAVIRISGSTQPE